jgi:phasin family protein
MAADNVMSIQQVQDQVRHGYADLAALYKGNFEAAMASSQALIGGCQSVTATLLAFAQSRAQEGLATGKRLAECGSPSDAAEIQLDFARATVQAYANQLSQLSETLRKIVNDAYTPFERRVETVVKEAAESVAA